MLAPDSKLLAKLQARADEGNLRSLKTSVGRMDFTSNDYLGLARSPYLKENIAKAYAAIPWNGSTGSRLLTGQHTWHKAIEDYLAEAFEAPAVTAFASGYMANLALFSCLPQRGDVVIYDEYIHACIRDGIRLSFADKRSFKHNDLLALEEALQMPRSGACYVAVESLYSVHGDVAALKAIAGMCKKYKAYLIVDEAHTTGVVGPAGRGACVEAGISADCLAIVYTFGKGMGVHGGLIASSPDLKELLVNLSRPFIYTTAVDAHTLIGMKEALDFVCRHPELTEQLQANIQHFARLMGTEAAPIPGYESKPWAIQPIQIPGNHRVKQMAAQLQAKDIDIRPVTYPTVPLGQESLRVVLHAFNTKEEIEYLVQAFLEELHLG